MNGRRLHSDPGIARLDPIWKQQAPCTWPSNAYIIPSFSQNRHTPQRIATYAQSLAPTRDMGVNYPSVSGSLTEEQQPQRSWFIKLIMAPYNAVERLLHCCCTPSEQCLRCVKLIYMVVLIVGGIISTIVAIVPHV